MNTNRFIIRALKFCIAVVAAVSCILSVSGVNAQSSPSAFTTGYRYDAGSRLVGTIRPDPDGAGTLRFAAIRNTYNSQGLLTLVETGQLANWFGEGVMPASWTGFTVYQRVESTYDIWGSKLTERVADGAGTPSALTQYSYDVVGRVECIAQRMNPAAYGSLPASACTVGLEGTHGPDRISRNGYDAIGRILTIQKAYGTANQINYATYTYYPSGPQESVTDANNNKSYYSYDGFARQQYWYFPSKTTQHQYNSADYEFYGYDRNGNRTLLRKRDGRNVYYGYDNLNRLTSEQFPGSTSPNVYYSYDLRNLQLQAHFGYLGGAGITSTYDGFGRLKTSTTNQSGSALALLYEHDAEGNRTKLTHPDGNYFVYRYDGLNRLDQITENGTSTVLASLAYDAAGRRSTLTRGGGVTSTTFGYDGVSRLSVLLHNLAGIAYDEVRGFTHNPASQIVTRTLNNAVYSFSQIPNTTINYAVNGLNQYTSLVSGVTATPMYDSNGNMTWDGATNYSYDIQNRLTGASGAKTVSVTYDPKGRLYQSSGTGGTTRFLYDRDGLVAEYSASGSVVQRYVHGTGADEPLIWYTGAAVGSSNRRYHHTDHQGSVTAVADSAGNALLVNTYDPYGVPASSNTGRFQYTGQIMLPDLGLYHYKARIYYPILGRFMQTDPVGYADDLDLYTYVGNDPTNKTDPDGKIAFLPLIPVALKALDISMTAAEVYTAAQTGGAAAIGRVALEALATSAMPGGKIVAKVVDKVHDIGTAAKGVEKTASGGRVGDFTRAQIRDAKAENAAVHGGEMACKDCARPLQNVKSERGVPTPANQAQVHHDPAIKHGGGQHSTPVVLCPDCHKRRHSNE